MAVVLTSRLTGRQEVVGPFEDREHAEAFAANSETTVSVEQRLRATMDRDPVLMEQVGARPPMALMAEVVEVDDPVEPEPES